MDEIIEKIFEDYNYTNRWQNDSLTFYVNESQKLASYFLINNINCANIENDDFKMKEKLNQLETDYLDRDETKSGIKGTLIDTFQDKSEASQLDKNTSVIYLVKISDVNMLSQQRNLIYSIEESPNYFRRYIISYTEKQVSDLKKMMIDYGDGSIVDLLTDLANNEVEYYSLLEGSNINGVYELVIRLFSKIPFLQYRFKAEPLTVELESELKKRLDVILEKYDEKIRNSETTLKQLLEVEKDFYISESEVDNIFKELMEGKE